MSEAVTSMVIASKIMTLGRELRTKNLERQELEVDRKRGLLPLMSATLIGKGEDLRKKKRGLRAVQDEWNKKLLPVRIAIDKIELEILDLQAQCPHTHTQKYWTNDPVIPDYRIYCVECRAMI